MQIRVQPPSSAVTALAPLGLPASSPAPRRLLLGALLAPTPASGRALAFPPPGAGTPTWATWDSGRQGWARRTLRPRARQSSGRREEVVGKRRREGPLAGGRARVVASALGTHTRETRLGGGPEVRPARTNESGLATGRRCAPGGPRFEGGRGKAEAGDPAPFQDAWCADPRSGAVAAPGTRGLFLFSHQRDRSSLEPQGGLGRGSQGADLGTPVTPWIIAGVRGPLNLEIKVPRRKWASEAFVKLRKK